MDKTKKSTLSVNVKAYLGSLAVIAVLMIVTFLLTKVIPSGEYQRTVNEAGQTIIDHSVPFQYTEGGIPLWKWILSPFLVLSANGSGVLIAVIIFLLVVGGIFEALGRCGLMKYMLDVLINKFSAKKYTLLYVLIFFFMAMGSLVGSFEEVIPMVPIVCALSAGLGWDAMTGLAMSLLAAGCGFATGVCNPFTVGVAQTLAGLPMFSGIPLRLLSFVLIYLLLTTFVRKYAVKIEKTDVTGAEHSYEYNANLSKALKVFGGILGTGLVLVVVSGFVKALQDYTLIIVALAFLLGGLLAAVSAKMTAGEIGKSLKDGILGILPCVLMILMASSIKYTLEEARVLDTILAWAVTLAESLPGWAVILFIYLIVLVMNFFIASGSAKAFMLIPLIVPMAQIFGVSPQLCIVAYAFGDGFSNVFYPTNPGLLVALGLADVRYGAWAKYSVKFQVLNLLLTSGVLMLGYFVGY